MSSDIRMLVKVERPYYDPDGKYFHVIGKPVKMEYSQEDQEWMPYGSFWNHEGDPFYSDLQVHSQGEIPSGNIYAYDVEYHDIVVRLYEAELMVKTLRSINRKLERMKSELGPAHDFASYLARAGKAMGITQYGFLPFDGSRTFKNGDHYHWWNASMLSLEIAVRVKTLREAAGVTVEA